MKYVYDTLWCPIWPAGLPTEKLIKTMIKAAADTASPQMAGSAANPVADGLRRHQPNGWSSSWWVLKLQLGLLIVVEVEVDLFAASKWRQSDFSAQSQKNFVKH